MKRRRRRLPRGHAGTWLGAEHRRERDEAVEVNIPPHLLALWRRTKGQFKGTPHERYEQFMQHVHDVDGSGEEMTALQDDADDKLAAMIREYEGRAA